MSQDISLVLVFAAGLFSFFSPCVLPLLPSYFGILGGLCLGRTGPGGETANSGEGAPGGNNSQNRFALVRGAAAFVLGFGAVFITLGILVSATFSLMGGALKYINRAAGLVVIVLGLNVIFDFLSFLNYEKRPFLKALANPPRRARFIPAAFIAGAAFGAGWTPCIGPVLTAILLMAGQTGKTGIAAFYLALYSAGLALPFLLAALFFDFFLKHAAKFRSRLPLIRRICGILLVIIGISILTGRYSALNVVIQKWIFGYIDWAETRAFPFRLLASWLAWIQNF